MTKRNWIQHQQREEQGKHAHSSHSLGCLTLSNIIACCKSTQVAQQPSPPPPISTWIFVCFVTLLACPPLLCAGHNTKTVREGKRGGRNVGRGRGRGQDTTGQEPNTNRLAGACLPMRRSLPVQRECARLTLKDKRVSLWSSLSKNGSRAGEKVSRLRLLRNSMRLHNLGEKQ